MGSWHRRAFCKCGFDAGAPFCGSITFTRWDYPVCPECGESSYGINLKTVRWVSTGWFGRGHYEEKCDTKEQGS